MRVSQKVIKMAFVDAKTAKMTLKRAGQIIRRLGKRGEAGLDLNLRLILILSISPVAGGGLPGQLLFFLRRRRKTTIELSPELHW
jgi:hypothetical protein